MATITSTFGLLGRLAALGACFVLAACGQSQNWQDSKAFVTVSGTVSGFTGGTLALWNNGKDKTPVSANGTFKFSLSIANGDDYAVAVATQPAGLSCTVANGSGTAGADVTNIAVTCAPYTFTLRPLPSIYTTGKAINYSAFRTIGGPAVFEVPSDSDVLQDLTLLHAAGYNLLRLFGAETPATDVINAKVLSIAAQYYPDMKFQLGIALGGLTSCSDPKNDQNVAYLITKLSKSPNVVTVSVGNETSFYSKFMPLACLEGYVRTIRSQVTQPVTADDDFSFYSGNTTAGGDRVAVKPDTILALIDFASIHLYPISNAGSWNWPQSGTAAGPDRAKAMMEESLRVAKGYYNQVATYQYRGAGGLTVSVGASLPIVIGETGWKAVQTNFASGIEEFAALQVNAKWYTDLLYGSPGKYPSWERSAGGPLAIFYFEAFDEAWKRTDDGWGLWDAGRIARYAFCGTPSGPACNANVYQGAGFFTPAQFATITFDSPTVSYNLTGFAGAEDSEPAQPDPAGGANKVGKVVKSAAADFFAGTIVSTHGGLTAGIIPFTAANTRMTVRVYSPDAGIKVRLKVEDSTNSAHSVETEATTTKVNTWETLTFDFANAVAGTTALNPAFTYDRVIIFFNFGVTGAAAGAKTYYFDDVAFIGGGGIGGGGGGGPFSDISFDSAGIVYTLTGFAGAEDSSLQPDPTNAANMVVRVRRSATAEIFAGTTVSTGANNSVGKIPFTAGNTKMTVRVYSPSAGIHVRLKVEDAADSTHSVETEAITTVANAWETLTFDFANQVAGTPALNLAFTYNKVTIFFNFGVTGATAGAQTYYFDDVLFVTGGGGASCGTTAPTCAPTTAIPAGSLTIYSDAAAVANFNPHPDWGQNPPVVFSEVTIAGNKSLQYVWAGPGGLYEGLDWAANAVDVSTKGKLHLDFWTADLASVKVSIISAGAENAFTQALTTGRWNSVDIDLSNYTVPDKSAIIQIKLEPTAAGTLYVDNIYFWGTGGGGGGGFVNGIYADDYVGALPATSKSAQGGDVGFFFDPRFVLGTTATYDFGGVVGAAQDPQGVHNFFYGLGLNAPAITDAFFGGFVNAPGNGTVNVATFTNIRLRFWGPAELFEQSFTPAIQVVLAGPTVGGCGSNSGRSEIQTIINAAQKIGAGSLYTLPLNGFTLKFACSGETTVAQVLANIAQVNISLIGANIQYVIKDPNGTAYPNGLNIGPINFN